jgi:hypothetical protein
MFDFQFSHIPSDNARNQASNVSPWTTAPTAASDALSSPFFSHDFSGAFTDLTNDMGWGRQEGVKNRSAMATAVPALEYVDGTASESECSIHESPIAIPSTPSAATDMLVKGNFLCASKLLQLAANSNGSMDQTFNTTRTSATSMTMDVRDDLDSPSRESTPMSVANAVLYGTDDSPPIDKRQQQQRHLHSTGRSLQQEYYSSFCVSAGESRDATPVSPTHNGVDMYYQQQQQGQQQGAHFGAMFTTQTQQQLQSHRSQSLQRSASVSSAGAPQPEGSATSPTAYYQQQQQAVPAPLDSCARRAVRSHHVPTIVAPQKPTIVELASQQTCVLVLEFKMGRKLRCRCDIAEYVTTPASAVGQYFIAAVDCSGLEDAGVCTSVVPLSERHTLHRAFGHSDQATIVRVANSVDCNLINDELPEMEEAALMCCHDLIHFLHLPFVCVDAEYSFDKKGCKVFYALAPQACTSIVPNVSRLQRELSCKMKCKMVLEQVRQQPN